MSTTSENESSISAGEFQALEQKVLRAVELIKTEREARVAAEAELAQLRAQFDSHATRNNVVEDELATLRQERDAVRKRVEKMLHQLDELA
jgi:uncharacterized coiled-coil DUF342 family protein